jgi:predicted nucleotidyltransferase
MVKNLKKIIEYLSHEKPILAAYLFGSTAKGTATGKSDIDLGIILKDDFDLLANFDYKLRLMGDLKDLTGKTVDVVFINKADPILQHQIRKYGKVIFERDRRLRIEYEVRARKNYFDFIPMHRMYMERMLGKS